MFLDTAAESAVKQRVARLERSTGVEVIAAVIARADSYPEIPWKAFALGASLALLAAVAAALTAPGWEAAEAIVETAVAAPAMALHEKILFGAFIFGIIGLFTFLGIVTPGMGWFLYFFLIPFWAMFPVVIFGSGVTFYILAAYLIGFPLAKLLVSRSATYRKALEDLKRKGRATIGGFTVGGSGGGWSSSGGSWSSGGGGFSGGGGSSGGGGASGRW